MNEPVQAVGEDRVSRSAHFYSHLNRWRNVLRRRWWVLPVTATVALGVQGYLIWGTPPNFQSVGRMIINIRLQIPNATSAQYAEELSNFLGTQVALMNSDTVRNRALSSVQGLKRNFPSEPIPLKISVSPKTSIFN